MKVPVVKIRVDDKFFAIELTNVKHFFEPESIIKVASLPDFVKGIVKYNNHVYPLISIKQAWGLENNEDSRTALAIIFNNKEYAILIDEIIKIDALEKKENFMFEVFEENGNLIGHLNLDFLENIDIPTFKNSYEQKNLNLTNRFSSSFLLFRCGQEILGIDTALIKKAEEQHNSDTVMLNDTVINIASLDKLYKTCTNNSILILEDNKLLALSVGEIIDIAIIKNNTISTAQNGLFDRFFIYNAHEVKVFSNAILKQFIDEHGVHSVYSANKEFDEKIEVLILDIGSKQIAIRMENVVEIEDCKISQTSFSGINGYIKGMVDTREGVTTVLSLENFLQEKLDNRDELKIVVLKHKNKAKALLINEINDLVYVDKKNIVVSNSNDSFIGGVVILDNKMIPLLNLDWPVNL